MDGDEHEPAHEPEPHGDEHEALRETEHNLDDLIVRLDATMQRTGTVLETVAHGLDGVTSALARLDPSAAAGHALDAAKETASDVSDVAGEGGNAVLEAAKTPVSAAQDVIETGTGTLESAAGAVSHGRRFRLQRHRRG